MQLGMVLAALVLLACTPAEVAPLECAPDDWCQVRRTLFHVCALRGDGTPQCWGWDSGAESYEQIEDWMDYYDCFDCVDWGQVSQMPDGPFQQVEFTMEGETVCGLTFEGDVECWGQVRKELSRESALNLQRISVGRDQVCGVDLAGNVDCWDGGIEASDWTTGDEDSSPSETTPVDLITAESMHICALHAESTVECWGVQGFGPESLDYGQVSDTPLGTGFKALASTDYANCALSPSNTWTCWGDRSWCGGDPSFCYWDLIDPQVPGGYAYDPYHDDIEWGYGTITAPALSSFDMDWPGCGLAADGRLVCGNPEIVPGVPQAPSWVRFLQIDINYGGCGVTTNHDLVCWGWASNADFDGWGEVIATYIDEDGDETPFAWRMEK